MGFSFSGGMVKDWGRKGRFANPPSLLARIAAGLRKLKVGSHAQPALTREQRKSRAKTNRHNARFAFTETLRSQGLHKMARNISKSRFIKAQQEIDVWIGGAYDEARRVIATPTKSRPVLAQLVGRGRMVSRAPSVQNIPRREGETRGSVSSVPVQPAT